MNDEIPLDEMPPEVQAMLQQFLAQEKKSQTPRDRHVASPSNLDYEYISHACKRYHDDALAWKWRSDAW